jgi:hypothetical protein
MKTKSTHEYDTFEHTMREQLKVPHSIINDKLGAEIEWTNQPGR